MQLPCNKRGLNELQHQLNELQMFQESKLTLKCYRYHLKDTMMALNLALYHSVDFDRPMQEGYTWLVNRRR